MRNCRRTLPSLEEGLCALPIRGQGPRSAATAVYVERLIRNARHIEVQINLRTNHGAISHLWGSAKLHDPAPQTRKLIEVAPKPPPLEREPALRRIIDAARRLAAARELRQPPAPSNSLVR